MRKAKKTVNLDVPVIQFSEEDARRIVRLQQEIDRRQRWQKSIFAYAEERLHVPIATLDWRRIPEYKGHKWDATVFPIEKLFNAIVNKQWAAVEGATGTGKTFALAVAALWFLEMFEDSYVITTAPKEKQLELHMWKDIETLYKYFNRGKKTKLAIRMVEGEETWIMVGTVAGTRTEEATATKAAGAHRRDMFIIVEETPGIEQKVLDSYIGTCSSPNNIIVAIGNPNHQLDTLHKFATSRDVVHINMSALDHPNVVLDDPTFIEGACSKIGIQRILNRYKDENHPLVLSRVHGKCPSQAQNALIRLEWCYDAADEKKRNRHMLSRMGARVLGIDVANSDDGDEAAIADGVGAVLNSIESFPCPNVNQLGEYVARVYIKDQHVPPENIAIDGIGVGAGAVNVLLDMDLQVYNVISSESPVEVLDENVTEKFYNLRSQMWWEARIDLQDGNLALPFDEELFTDLTSPRWSIRQGKIIIESKQDIRKRIGRSPNKGDAFVMWNWCRKNKSGIMTMGDVKDVHVEQLESVTIAEGW